MSRPYRMTDHRKEVGTYLREIPLSDTELARRIEQELGKRINPRTFTRIRHGMRPRPRTVTLIRTFYQQNYDRMQAPKMASWQTQVLLELREIKKLLKKN